MIRLTRELRAAIDHRRAGEKRSSNNWSGVSAAGGLLPFVVLRATVAGEIDPKTGYLCDIKQLDDLLEEYGVRTIERSSEMERASLEQLIQSIWDRLIGNAPEGTQLERLELAVSPYLRCFMTRETSEMVHLTEQFEFSAAHRLHCRDLSEEENRNLFGKCNNPAGHGHNYFIEVTIAGEVDPKTGGLLAPGNFEEIVRDHAVRRLDHKHLNEDTEEFRDVNPSVENIAKTIWGFLNGRFAPARLTNVRVYETAKTWADYSEGPDSA